MKFEPSLYGPDMTYGDWDKIFLNDLVIMKKDKVWLEANRLGAAPVRLRTATTKARLASLCKGDAELCDIIGISSAATVRNLKDSDRNREREIEIETGAFM